MMQASVTHSSAVGTEPQSPLSWFSSLEANASKDDHSNCTGHPCRVCAAVGIVTTLTQVTGGSAAPFFKRTFGLCWANILASGLTERWQGHEAHKISS